MSEFIFPRQSDQRLESEKGREASEAIPMATKEESVVNDLISFLNASPTAFHAVGIPTINLLVLLLYFFIASSLDFLLTSSFCFR